MRTKEQIAELILNVFKERNISVGGIIQWKVFYSSDFNLNLTQEEREAFPDAVSYLENEGYALYEEEREPLLRLTQIGFDRINPENKTA